MSRTPRVQKAAEAEVVPTTDSSLDEKPLMDLSDRRAVVIHFDLPWDRRIQQDD